MSFTALDTAIDQALSESKGTEHSAEAEQAPAVAKEADGGQAASPAEEKGTEAAQLPETSEELLDQETFDKLKSDPEKLRKELNKAFTQKTQELSEQRKQIEPVLELVEALSNDPQAAVRSLAERYGITITEAQQAGTKAEVQQVAADTIAELKASLGPELEFLADRLGPAIEKLVFNAAGKVVEKEIGPIKEQVQEAHIRAVTQDVEANLEAFSKDYPDWKKHETKMVEISSWLQPAKNEKGEYPTWKQYMESLYHLATKDFKKADIVKETVQRLTEAAKKSEGPDTSVTTNRVAKAPPPRKGNFDADFDEAANDARQGITYE